MEDGQPPMGLDEDEVEDFHASILANDIAAVRHALYAPAGPGAGAAGPDGGDEEDMSIRYQRAHAVADSRDSRRRSGVHIAALASVTNEMLHLLLRATKDVNGRDVRPVPARAPHAATGARGG